MFIEDIEITKGMIQEAIREAKEELRADFAAQIEKLKTDTTPEKVVKKEVKKNEL